MSKIIPKFLMGLLVLVIIVSAITAVRTNLLTGGNLYDIFVAVFDSFPFAKEMAEIAATIGKFQTTLKGLSPSNILDDLTKIFAMSIVCPMVMSIVCSNFLKVPNNSDWYEMEKYMSGFGYRIKEVVINVIMMPVCAMLTAVLVSVINGWLRKDLPFINPNIISVLVLVVIFLASIMIQAVESPKHVGLIIRHRLITDLLGSVLKIIGMNLLCFLIALALLNDQGNAALGYVVVLMIYLAGLELLLKSIMGMLH